MPPCGVAQPLVSPGSSSPAERRPPSSGAGAVGVPHSTPALPFGAGGGPASIAARGSAETPITHAAGPPSSTLRPFLPPLVPAIATIGAAGVPAVTANEPGAGTAQPSANPPTSSRTPPVPPPPSSPPPTPPPPTTPPPTSPPPPPPPPPTSPPSPTGSTGSSGSSGGSSGSSGGSSGLHRHRRRRRPHRAPSLAAP